MEKFGREAVEMNTLNSDGKAFNGNKGPLFIAFGILGAAVLGGVLVVGYEIITAIVASAL